MHNLRGPESRTSTLASVADAGRLLSRPRTEPGNEPGQGLNFVTHRQHGGIQLCTAPCQTRIPQVPDRDTVGACTGNQGTAGHRHKLGTVTHRHPGERSGGQRSRLPKPPRSGQQHPQYHHLRGSTGIWQRHPQTIQEPTRPRQR